MPESTYMVRRFCFDDSDPAHRLIVKTGLTLEEAQRHCQDPSTSHSDPKTGHVVWFDGYERESR